MAKKKKTQLKPVARGFATTSVPKKVVEPKSEPESAPVEQKTEVAASQDTESPSKDVASSSEAKEQEDEFDPEGVEKQSLQNLVDRLQDKIEREITRSLKTIEYDRRFAQTLPRLQLPDAFTDRILSLAQEFETSDKKPAIDEPEDKVTARIGITYGVLRRLGFPEDKVEECLRSMKGVDLDEAYDWLYLHCPEDALDYGKRLNDPAEPKTPRTRSSQSPRSPRAPTTPVQPSSPSSKGETCLNANAPEFVPSGQVSTQQRSDISADDQASAKSRTIASYNSTRDDSSDDEFTDPNVEYVRLKLQISELQRQGSVSGESALRLQKLQDRLTDVMKHYFFGEKQAQALYKVEQKKLQSASLRSKLQGNERSGPPPVEELKQQQAPLPKPQSNPTEGEGLDIFAEGQDDSETGLFDILEEMPTTETTADGTTVRVHDMSLPKHWSGRTPRTLLSDTVSKMDQYAAITYRCISGSSRAKRAAVSVRWNGGKTQDWSMDDIACHDMVQAENYTATVALHSLTYPAAEGFAFGTPNSVGAQTSFRLLPAIFRDLWDELEDNRKEEYNSINRGVWANLRGIVEPKLDMSKKSDMRSAQNTEAKGSIAGRRSDVSAGMYSEQLAMEFLARQASPAYQEMLQFRNQLPIAQYRNEIIASLDTSQILVLSGETGCGKSTQVPAFILEDQLSKGKHCRIYCTEPRRISAISLAQRVSRELGDPAGAVGTSASLVGYSVRLESCTSRTTRLAFVTNGIALRLFEGDNGSSGQGTGLDEITHIIIDEVHERSIESDFLLIILKSLLLHRPDLKVILMSATVDADKIANYFNGCPILSVPGRTFPVSVNYLEDAVEYTQWAIDESSPYAKRLHDKFYQGKNRKGFSEEMAALDDEDEDDTSPNAVKLERRYSSTTVSTVNLLDERIIPYELIVRLLERICFEDPSYSYYSAAVLVFMPGLGEIRRLNDMLVDHAHFGTEAFRLYPLHSTMSSENQGAVFDIPPPGVRKIVIATNIAETGITIPDITCVIDSGKQREMRFDEKRQISRLLETFVARSNAAQRRGRAGRVQPGLCFHLFTKLRHDTLMAEHPLPEMMRLSLSDLALRIKILKVKLGSSIEDVLSRALDPPAAINIQRAISALVEVRALTTSEDITPMGRLLSKLPTDVHLGKFLLIAALFRCLDPALTIAATLNSKSPFLSPIGSERDASRARFSFRVENSDFLTVHSVFTTWRSESSKPGSIRDWCRRKYLSHQNLQQIEELRQQFLGYLIDSAFINVDRAFTRELNRTRFRGNRTRFVAVPPELDANSSNVALVNAALAAGLYPKILDINNADGSMRTITNNKPVAFHPSSVNFGKTKADFGINYLSYYTLMQSKKLYAWETGPVDDTALLLLCGECEFKLISNSIFLDRKIRFRVSPKTGIALKLLRNQLNTLLAQQFRGKPLVESQILWDELAMMVLGKAKVREEEVGVRP